MADGNKSRNPPRIKIPIWRERPAWRPPDLPLCYGRPHAVCSSSSKCVARSDLLSLRAGYLPDGCVCLLPCSSGRPCGPPLGRPMPWRVATGSNAPLTAIPPIATRLQRSTEATDDEPSMQCHPSGASLMPCSMACCQTPEHVFAASILFVLPAPATLAAPMHSLPAVSILETTKILTAFAPPSPPPKRTLLSL